MLGERIVELRIERGLKQIELAEELGIANTTLSQYESGQRRPSDEVKIRMATFFDVTLDYLMDYKGEEEMNEELFSTVSDPIKRRVEEQIRENAKDRLRVICKQREVAEKSEDEILLEIKYAQERVIKLNQEIRVGLEAIKDKLEVKENLKELMAQYQREY